MALKNRTETSGAIQAQAAVVGETEYKQNLDTDFAQNCVFRKDVSDTDTAAAGTKTLDFLDIDYIEVAQSNDVAYTLNNVQQGEIKFLKITKTANQTVTFVNATDTSTRQGYITTITEVIYRITNKDGDLFLESINIDNDRVLEYKVLPIGAWDMDTLTSVLVAHGLSDKDKIRTLAATIWADDGTGPINFPAFNSSGVNQGSVGTEVGGSITIARVAGGTFDSAAYSVTPTIDGNVTRGYLTIGYTK